MTRYAGNYPNRLACSVVVGSLVGSLVGDGARLASMASFAWARDANTAVVSGTLSSGLATQRFVAGPSQKIGRSQD